MPDPLPGLRHRAGPQKEGDADIRCPNTRSCPAQLRERLFHLAGRGAFDIEVLGYEAAIALLEAGLVTDEGDLFALTAEDLAAAGRSSPRKDGELAANARQAAGQPGGGQDSGRCGGCWSRCRSGTSARPRPGRWPASSARSTRSRAASAEQLAAVDGVGPTIAESVVDWFDGGLAPRDRRQVARGRGALEEERRRRPGPKPLAGLTVVVTGSLDELQPGRGGRGDRQPRRQGQPARCRRRPPSWWSGDTPGSKYDKAVELKVPILDEAGFSPAGRDRRPPPTVAQIGEE